MNTFLPFVDFAESARALDPDRLGNQIKEGGQIMTALVERRGWIHHPATKMWAGYEPALACYLIECQAALTGRSGALHRSLEPALDLAYSVTEPMRLPPWLGDPVFHFAMRSNLIRKRAAWYGPLFPGVRPDAEYAWPYLNGDGYVLNLSGDGAKRVARGELADPRIVFRNKEI